MKAFLYKAKGAIALTLAMSMFCPQVFAAEAASVKAQEAGEAAVEAVQEKEVLTIANALERAKKHSPEILDIEASLEVLRENNEEMFDSLGTNPVPADYEYKKWVSGGWHSVVSGVFQLQQGIKQANLGVELQGMVLELTVRTFFQNIVALEDTVELLKESARMQDTTYKQGQVKHRLGMLSSYKLEQLAIAAQQAKDTLRMTEAGLEQVYISFNDILGVNPNTRFEFVYDVTFTPYELHGTIDQFINDKMNDDIMIKMQELTVDTAKFTNNYRSADTLVPTDDNDQLNYDKEKRALKTAKEEKETLIRNTYLKIKALETEYETLQASLKKAEAEYRAAQLSFQTGALTQLAVDGAEMAVTKAKNDVKNLVYEHDMLVFQFENPSILFSSTGGQ